VNQLAIKYDVRRSVNATVNQVAKNEMLTSENKLKCNCESSEVKYEMLTSDHFKIQLTIMFFIL